MLDKERSKIIVDFDISKLTFDSDLQNTKYILYKHLDNGCVHTTIGKQDSNLYPETFFHDPSKQYLSKQDLFEILDIQVIERNTSKEKTK